MALELPSWVVIAFNYAGLPWPGIDEDQLRAWATSVRTFAGNMAVNAARTNQVVAQLAGSSQSSFTAAMGARWEHHAQLVDGLHEPLDIFADALDAAADVVVAQKLVVIGAAVAFATEFAATQVGAFFTLGADEAALPEEIISTREIVDGAIEILKGALIGELINVAVQEISDHISRFIGNLLSGGLEVVTEYQSLKVSYSALRDAAQTIRGQASQTRETGEIAYSENANRDLEDPGEGGAIDSGWAAVVQAVKQALLDLALGIFQNLPRVFADIQDEDAAAFDNAAARDQDADAAAGHAAPRDGGRGPSAESGAGEDLAAGPRSLTRTEQDIEEIAAVGAAGAGGAIGGGSGSDVVAGAGGTDAFSDADRAAVWDYTTNDGYKTMNRYLRDPEDYTPEDAAAIQARSDRVSTALAKLPPRPGSTFRGVDFPDDVLNNYEEGTVVTEKAFTSTSTDPAIASENFKGNAIMIVTGKSGRDISKFSQYPEKEILYDKGTQFMVTGKSWDPQRNLWFIHMEEVGS